MRGRSVALLCAVALSAVGTAGCMGGAGTSAWDAPGYYWQSVNGHLSLMRAARPVGDWLADPATQPALKDRLALTQRMRRFAVNELHLPDNASYTRYADLHRRAAVWNVVAAPELSLTLKTWCFPVVGCVGYRGYFDEAQAEALASGLRQDGWDAAVYPVPAYSTLGWMNWLGGDPLLSTFVGYPEGEVARLVFHELAHQVLYVAGDTRFNESFATAVERLGGERWLAQASPEARQGYAQFDQRRQAFRALTKKTREKLEQIYPLSNDLKEIDATDKNHDLLQKKKQIMIEFRQDYERLKAQWGGYNGYDAWVARANNASFAVQAAYDDAVPAFTALFEREGRDFPRFYEAVRRLAELPKAERDAELNRLKGLSSGRLG
jgi:predicted aminopeptidase